MKVKTNRKSNNKQQKYTIPVLPNRHINYAVVQTTPRKIEKHVLDYNDSLRKYFDEDTNHRNVMLTFFMAVNGMIIDGHNAAVEKLNLMVATREAITNLQNVCNMLGLENENENIKFINLERDYEELAKLRLQLSEYTAKMEKLVKELVPLLIDIEKVPSALKSATDKFNKSFKEAEEEIRRLNKETAEEADRIRAAAEEAARKAAEEAAKQAEIQDLLARLQELGYEHPQEEQPKEQQPFEVVETIEEQVIIPKIKITVRKIDFVLTPTELKNEICKRLAIVKGKHNDEFKEEFIEEMLEFVQALSFYEKKPRTELFETLPMTYSGFNKRFDKEIKKYNIKLYTRIKCLFDDDTAIF